MLLRVVMLDAVGLIHALINTTSMDSKKIQQVRFQTTDGRLKTLDDDDRPQFFFILIDRM